MPEISYPLACIFVASIVRGFSGFGFALIVVSTMSFFLPMQTIVPAMIMLEVAAGLYLLPSIWMHIHWRSIGVMTITAMIFTPVGILILLRIPQPSMQIMAASVVLVLSGLLLVGFHLKRMPTIFETILTGAGSGILNGAVGLGGPPIIIFFLGSPMAVEAGRASIIAGFLAIDLASLIGLIISGALSKASAYLALYSLPPLIAGVYIGASLVKYFDQKKLRRYELIVLLIMGIVNVLKTFGDVVR